MFKQQGFLKVLVFENFPKKPRDLHLLGFLNCFSSEIQWFRVNVESLVGGAVWEIEDNMYIFDNLKVSLNLPTWSSLDSGKLEELMSKYSKYITFYLYVRIEWMLHEIGHILEYNKHIRMSSSEMDQKLQERRKGLASKYAEFMTEKNIQDKEEDIMADFNRKVQLRDGRHPLAYEMVFYKLVGDYVEYYFQTGELVLPPLEFARFLFRMEMMDPEAMMEQKINILTRLERGNQELYGIVSDLLAHFRFLLEHLEYDESWIDEVPDQRGMGSASGPFNELYLKSA